MAQTLRTLFKASSVVLSLLSSSNAFAKGDLTMTNSTLTLEAAKLTIAAAEASVLAHKAPGGAIAISDDGGHVLLVERLDGTFPAAAMISIEKAKTAAEFRKDTNVFEQAINKGRIALAANHDLSMPLQGGIPIRVHGKVIGAVGVSGTASAKQDEEVALDAVQAIQNKIEASN